MSMARCEAGTLYSFSPYVLLAAAMLLSLCKGMAIQLVPRVTFRREDYCLPLC